MRLFCFCAPNLPPGEEDEAAKTEGVENAGGEGDSGEAGEGAASGDGTAAAGGGEDGSTEGATKAEVQPTCKFFFGLHPPVNFFLVVVQI